MLKRILLKTNRNIHFFIKNNFSNNFSNDEIFKNSLKDIIGEIDGNKSDSNNMVKNTLENAISNSLISPDIFDKVKYFENQINKYYPIDNDENGKMKNKKGVDDLYNYAESIFI